MMYINMWKEVYFERLAHAFMEAEKSHDMPSAGQKLRKAGDIVPVQTQRPETREADGISPSSGET